VADRRSHNHGQIVAFLDQHHPDTAPGSPDPDQAPDDNKKGSRVIAKSGAQKRIDSALGGKRPDKNGRMVLVDLEISRSYRLLSRLFEEVPARLDDEDTEAAMAALRAKKRRGEARRHDAHRLAARFVLLNTNTAGGHQELERISELGRGKDGDPAAREVARLCRRVIKGVLDELDARGYWLGWGTDQEEAERQAAAADRRKTANVLAAAEGETGREAIVAYRELMLKTGSTATEAEELTAEHFSCSPLKVRKAVAEEKEPRAS